MQDLEQLLLLFIAAVLLAAAARRVGAPYPVFLAIGGALLAFLPGAPAFTVAPELVLALFVAPVLLDAAYDTSLRDLRDNWAPVTSLVVSACRSGRSWRAPKRATEDATSPSPAPCC
jgi:NhaP-type Na+/H+ or K+/H+ antiporter